MHARGDESARLPLEYRDYARILIAERVPAATWFSPWKCIDLRHSYEKCQYDEYQRRVAILKTERPTQFLARDEHAARPQTRTNTSAQRSTRIRSTKIE